MKLSYSVILIFIVSLVCLVCHARVVRQTRIHHHIFKYEPILERIDHINIEYFFEKWLQNPTDISEEELLKQLSFFINGLKTRMDTSAEDEYWLLRQG